MAKWCPEKQNFALYLDCRECERRTCEAFFCLVAGSRAFDDYDLLCSKLDELLSKQKDVVIVSGGAKGADSLAERYAAERGYPRIIFPAEWDKYGKRAGYFRNRQMYEFISKADKCGCVLFWDGKSRGTSHSIDLAAEFKVPCKMIRF